MDQQDHILKSLFSLVLFIQLSINGKNLLGS